MTGVAALGRALRAGEVTAVSLAEASLHVARYKVPKAIVRVPQVLRSPSGKADYRWAAEVAVTGG